MLHTGCSKLKHFGAQKTLVRRNCRRKCSQNWVRRTIQDTDDTLEEDWCAAREAWNDNSNHNPKLCTRENSLVYGDAIYCVHLCTCLYPASGMFLWLALCILLFVLCLLHAEESRSIDVYGDIFCYVGCLLYSRYWWQGEAVHDVLFVARFCELCIFIAFSPFASNTGLQDNREHFTNASLDAQWHGIAEWSAQLSSLL